MIKLEITKLLTTKCLFTHVESIWKKYFEWSIWTNTSTDKKVFKIPKYQILNLQYFKYCPPLPMARSSSPRGTFCCCCCGYGWQSRIKLRVLTLFVNVKTTSSKLRTANGACYRGILAEASCHWGTWGTPPLPQTVWRFRLILIQNRVKSITVCVILKAKKWEIVLVTLCIQNSDWMAVL